MTSLQDVSAIWQVFATENVIIIFELNPLNIHKKSDDSDDVLDL